MKLGAVAYCECSALTGEGVREVFETAARYAMKYRLSGDLDENRSSNRTNVNLKRHKTYKWT